MLAAFQDWKIGHSPVSMGRAPWLPVPFLQAMHHIAATNAAEEVAFHDRMRKKRQAFGGPNAS